MRRIHSDGNIADRLADAIIQSIDQEAKGRDDSIEDALKDLDALMAKAKEMVLRPNPASAYSRSGRSISRNR